MRKIQAGIEQPLVMGSGALAVWMLQRFGTFSSIRLKSCGVTNDDPRRKGK
jgi:hypothetical protein